MVRFRQLAQNKYTPYPIAMRLIWLAILLPFVVVTAATAARHSVAGRYMLSGIEATGGELRLDADGSYDWAISDKGGNRSSSGRWEKRGELIALIPDNPQNPSGIARIARTERWDDEAERLYLSQNWPAAWEEASKRCPLLTLRFNPDSVAGLPLPSNPKAAAAQAVKAQRIANAAIARWDKSRDNDPHKTSYLANASTALMAYFAASQLSTLAHEKEGLVAPGEDLVNFPERCATPRFFRPSDPLPAERHPHVGIIVGDPNMYSTMMGARVTLAYGDGARKEAVTGPGGMAMVPVDPERNVVAVTIVLDDTGAPVTLPTTINGAGIAVIDVNPDGLALRSLEPRTLRASRDGRLLPQDGIAGAYAPQ